MGSLKINGGINIARVHVENASYGDTYSDDIRALKFNDDTWRNGSVILANMNQSLAGNGLDYQFEGIDRFKVYKTIGKNNTKLHKIYETASSDERFVIDRIVGDRRDYQYYIYPICKQTVDGVEYETVAQPFSSSPIQIDTGRLFVIGLIAQGDKVYKVDKNNIWRFSLNIKDNGTTLNTNKLFTDTQNQYKQMTGSFRGYNTKTSISALIGEINCTDIEYVEDVEKIEAWEKFCKSSTLKLLIDTKGRFFVGEIDNNPSIEYGTSIVKESTITFSFIELDDFNNITILGEVYDGETIAEDSSIVQLYDIDYLYNVEEDITTTEPVDEEVEVF